jgi:conjugal transfer pilus assembly protein TraW
LRLFSFIFGVLPLFGSQLLAKVPAQSAESCLDHGVMGEVFPIQERNLMEVILQKLHQLQAEGKLEAYNQQIQAKVKSQIERPNPVSDIVHTKERRTFSYDPSITVAQDLKDHKGQVFHHKGDKVNPLHIIGKMTKPLLFIDGDDTDHLTWAFKMLKLHPLAKIILVKGAPLKIMEEIGLTIYFDQHGKITKKLGIKQVPAIVTQSGEVLKIEEMKVDDIYQEVFIAPPPQVPSAQMLQVKATTPVGKS